MVGFLVILGVGFGTLALHPFITYPLSLLLLPKIRLRASPDNVPARQTICVCAYNEEAVIESKVRNLLALKAAVPGLKVLVYVDASSDRTAEILGHYRDQIDVTVADVRHGKTFGMNLLMRKAAGSIVTFTDANVMIDPATFPRMAGYFDDPSVGCVCGHLVYEEHASATAKVGSRYWRMEEWIKRQESATGSVMGADGSIFAIRRALHRPPPDDIIDDMYVSFSILAEGYRIVSAPDVVATEKSVIVSSEEFRRKVRIACQAFNVHRLLWPRLQRLSPTDLYKYISHKLLRWLSFPALVVSFLCLEAAAALSGLWPAATALAAGTGLVFIMGYAGIKPFAFIYEIIVALLATWKGVLKSLHGERFQTWAPAKSIR